VTTDGYVAAGCVVLDADGRVLVLERPARAEWRLPKGHVEAGEAPAQAALRETTEESGHVDVALVAALGEQVVVYPNRGRVHRRREHFFAARLTGGRQSERPAVDDRQFVVHWLLPAEAGRRLSYVAERNALGKALALGAGTTDGSHG
jgi:8-oxo-dGTP pyrophosphatase MutT (NUDIX family)